MGTIYRPKYKNKKTKEVKQSAVYWIKYYRNGKPYRESTGSKKEADAKRLLKRREGDVANGKLPGIYFDKVRFEELAADIVSDYKINGRDIASLNKRLIHLNPAFERMRVTNVTSTRINAYVLDRLEEGAANATINRELAALKRMLNLGAKQTPPKVDRVPYIPKLEENNVRKGYFEHGDFLNLHDKMPAYLQGFVTFGYETGMRIGEITDLTWAQVDLDLGVVRLEPGETKNDDARTVYLSSGLKEVLQQQWENRKISGKVCPYVFPNEAGTRKIVNIKKAWSAACRECGLGYGYKLTTSYVKKWHKKLPAGPLFHDFRRTAVRNMDRAGISRVVAMKRSGHKTESVYNRYNIVDDKDMKNAARKMEKYLDSITGKVTGKVAILNNERANRVNS